MATPFVSAKLAVEVLRRRAVSPQTIWPRCCGSTLAARTRLLAFLLPAGLFPAAAAHPRNCLQPTQRTTCNCDGGFLPVALHVRLCNAAAMHAFARRFIIALPLRRRAAAAPYLPLSITYVTACLFPAATGPLRNCLQATPPTTWVAINLPVSTIPAVKMLRWRAFGAQRQPTMSFETHRSAELAGIICGDLSGRLPSPSGCLRP